MREFWTRHRVPVLIGAYAGLAVAGLMLTFLLTRGGGEKETATLTVGVITVRPHGNQQSTVPGAAQVPQIPLHVVSQSSSRLTLGWTMPIAPVQGYVFWVNGVRKSNTWSATTTQVTFGKVSGQGIYEVEAVAVSADGQLVYPPPVVTTAPTTTAPTTSTTVATTTVPTTTAPTTTTPTTTAHFTGTVYLSPP